MQPISRSIFTLMFVAGLPLFAYATVNVFSTNLTVGSSGAQVMLLQQILNKDPDTRIATTGTGSLGNETIYFGLLTKKAVARFQEKYASETLAPAGLLKGTGYVGALTRAKLNELSVTTGSISVNSSTSTTSAPPPASVASSSTVNPNLKNIDALISAEVAVAKAKGLSLSDIENIKSAMRESAEATTTDMLANFIELVKKNNQQTALNVSFSNKILASIIGGITSLLTPRHALAAGLPFGGPVGGSLFCTCSFTYKVFIGPLPPTYVTVLDYVPGSQAYLSYNIPATPWVLGNYAPGSLCIMRFGKYCIPIPSQGIISPMVGSAGL